MEEDVRCTIEGSVKGWRMYDGRSENGIPVAATKRVVGEVICWIGGGGGTLNTNNVHCRKLSWRA